MQRAVAAAIVILSQHRPVELVPLQPSEFVHWRNAVRASFGDRISPEDSVYMRDHRAEIDRLLACMDGDEIVGTGGADSFLMTLPGGHTAPVAGVAYITTLSTHRRRGIQRKIMTRIHEDARERGDVACILWASLGDLYGRYGYGNAIPTHNWKIRRAYAQFSHCPDYDGVFRVVRRDEAIPLMAAVYETARVKHPGMINRRPKRWQYEVHPRKNADDFVAIYEEDGEPRGYAQYVFQPKPSELDPFAMTIIVHEALAVDHKAHAAIWRFVFDEPLAEEIDAPYRPVDDPVYWMLADQRRLRRETNDSIWLKPLDTAALLSNRTYQASGSVVIEVVSADDDTRSRWELNASPTGSTCTATTKSAHITLPERALGAAYYGAVTPSILVATGEADVSAYGQSLLPNVDAMFRCSPAAWNPFHF